MSHSRIARNVFTRSLAAIAGLGLLAAGVVATSEVHAEADARGIMDKVALTRKLAGSEAVVKMSIIDKKGNERTREISMATKLYDDGKTEKRIYKFQSPADVKGTGVLVFDYETKADDVWVYLPALRKTRRIVSSQRSQSFMGSEFTYGDLNIPSLDDYNYKQLREESYGGEACYVIEVTPKTEEVGKSEGYSKKVYWVSKANHTIRRRAYYDSKGKELKELKTSDVKLLDSAKKRYRAMKMEMANKQNGRRSVFETKQVQFAPGAKDDYFTTRYLERQ